MSTYLASILTLTVMGLLMGCSDSEPPAVSEMPGARLAAACYACHGGVDRGSGSSTPDIRGRDAHYLVQAMEAYADGHRHNELMRRFVGGLSSSERSEIAAFYAALPGRPGRDDR